MSRILFLLLVFIIPHESYSQPYYEGEFGFAMLDFDDSNTDLDSTAVSELKEHVKKNSFRLLFDSSSFAVVLLDKYGDIVSRDVVDLKSLSHYNFNHTPGFETYRKNNTEEELNQMMQFIGNDQSIMEIDDIVFDTIIAGLSCGRTIIPIEGMEDGIIYVTKDLILPTMSYKENELDLALAKNDLAIALMTYNIMGINVTMGIDTFFNTIQHKEWFSIETENFTNAERE